MVDDARKYMNSYANKKFSLRGFKGKETGEWLIPDDFSDLHQYFELELKKKNVLWKIFAEESNIYRKQNTRRWKFI